ncbi:MAG: hypothetical protein ACTSPQ_13155, partial [Candidatus Helarchaeota archaeon]
MLKGFIVYLPGPSGEIVKYTEITSEFIRNVERNANSPYYTVATEINQVLLKNLPKIAKFHTGPKYSWRDEPEIPTSPNPPMDIIKLPDGSEIKILYYWPFQVKHIETHRVSLSRNYISQNMRSNLPNFE